MAVHGNNHVSFRIASDVGDADLEHLKGLTELQSLNLAGKSVTDAGLAHLQGLTSLTSLNLGFTSVSDAGSSTSRA